MSEISNTAAETQQTVAVAAAVAASSPAATTAQKAPEFEVIIL